MSENGVRSGPAEPLTNQLLRQLRERGGLTTAFRTTGRELSRRYGCTDVVFVIRDQTGTSGSVWKCSENPDSHDGSLGYFEPPSATVNQYFSGPGGDWLLARSIDGSGDDWCLFVHDVGRVDVPPRAIEHARFISGHRQLSSLVSVQIPGVVESIARLFLVNPLVDDGGSMLSAIVRLAREAGPSMLARHEQGRLRAWIRAEERALLARELHDGVIQSLLGLHLRMHVLRRQAGLTASARDLGAIEEELRQQVVALRELTESRRSAEFEPSQLVNHLRGLVERFGRESRLVASFSADVDHVGIGASMCREIVRVVQEALANIRRHSGASSAKVRLHMQGGHWVIEISDDGQGFPFNGRLTLDDLDRTFQGPRIIKERVRILGGDLIIDSGAWTGAKLEIRIPIGTQDAVA
jgi:signal transduction histidine kinase